MTIEEGMKMVLSGGIVGPAAEDTAEPEGVLPRPEVGDRTVALKQPEQTAERPPARALQTGVKR